MSAVASLGHKGTGEAGGPTETPGGHVSGHECCMLGTGTLLPSFLISYLPIP